MQIILQLKYSYSSKILTKDKYSKQVICLFYICMSYHLYCCIHPILATLNSTSVITIKEVWPKQAICPPPCSVPTYKKVQWVVIHLQSCFLEGWVSSVLSSGPSFMATRRWWIQNQVSQLIPRGCLGMWYRCKGKPANICKHEFLQYFYRII